jgi:hypothetical protein
MIDPNKVQEAFDIISKAIKNGQITVLDGSTHKKKNVTNMAFVDDTTDLGIDLIGHSHTKFLLINGEKNG